MRKFITIALFSVFALASNAQVFVGGKAGIAYNNEVFSAAFEPMVGYELNDRWAVGTGVAYGNYDGESYFVIDPFVRLNCWHNDRVFLDLKSKTSIEFWDGEIGSQIGIIPSLRFRINDHWDVSADLGIIGANVYDGASFAFGVNSTSSGVCFLYRF